MSAMPTFAQQTHLFDADAADHLDANAIASSAVKCLLLELETWPKPGLVSHIDSGSHSDMTADTFRASATALEPYFKELAIAGAEPAGMGRLRVIGLQAEGAMFEATGGINTHRGAIFGLGLLCAAAGARNAGRIDPTLTLGEVVATFWSHDILEGPVLLHSHGTRARRAYGAGGARAEAARGFPTIYRVGLPALRRSAQKAPDDAQSQRVETCFALIAALEDTNLLHRGGPDGLLFARTAAKEFLDVGGISNPAWREQAALVHHSFVARRLSPGGAADHLAMTLFCDAHERVVV